MRTTIAIRGAFTNPDRPPLGPDVPMISAAVRQSVRGARASPVLRKRVMVGCGKPHDIRREATVSTEDDDFRATGPGLFGFLTDSDDNVPIKAFGTVGYAPNVGVLGFSGIAADPRHGRRLAESGGCLWPGRGLASGP